SSPRVVSRPSPASRAVGVGAGYRRAWNGPPGSFPPRETTHPWGASAPWHEIRFGRDHGATVTRRGDRTPGSRVPTAIRTATVAADGPARLSPDGPRAAPAGAESRAGAARALRLQLRGRHPALHDHRHALPALLPDPVLRPGASAHGSGAAGGEPR